MKTYFRAFSVFFFVVCIAIKSYSVQEEVLLKDLPGLDELYNANNWSIQDIFENQIHLQMEAGKGDANAQYFLGSLAWSQQKISEAATYMRASADQGHLSAQRFLGLFYQGQDDSTADYYFELAANQGDVFAQFSLGHAFLRRNDFDKAEYYLKRASEQSANAYIQTSLGLLYWKKKDYEKAKKCWVIAADQGGAQAKDFLGRQDSIENLQAWVYSLTAIVATIIICQLVKLPVTA